MKHREHLAYQHAKGRSIGYRRLAFFWLAGVTLFHLWYIGSGALDLAPDEAHYWEWSRRLDWSYYSKGPMVAYLIAASTRLGGSSEFFVRLPAVFLALGTGVLVYLLARELFVSDRAAFLAVLTSSGILLYAAGSILMTIDAPLVFFWALGVFSVCKALRVSGAGLKGAKGGIGWWGLFALSLGLGLQSKYTMLLFLPCLWGYLLLSRSARPYLTSREPYIGLLLGSAFFVPVLAWNAQHQWVSLRHVMGLAGLGDGKLGASAQTFFEFLGSQLGVVSPLLFVTLVVAIVRAGRLGLKGRKEEHLFLFLFSAPFLGFFLVWSIHEKVEANWAAPAYLTAVLALSGWWEERLRRAGSLMQECTLAGILALVLVPGFALVAVGHFPEVLAHLGIDLPPRLDPTRRLHGWKELGAAVGRLLREPEGGELFLMSDRYQIASEMAFYVPGQPRVYNINTGRRMNQYDIWGGLDRNRGRDGLLVTGGDGEAPPSLQQACNVMHKVKVVETFYRGYPAQTFSVFRCREYKGLPPPAGRAAY